MTLLDAPQFDPKRARRNRLIVQCSAGTILLIFVIGWLVASRPVDWPWNWSRYYFGRAAVNRFLNAIEADDMPLAYGIWVRDKNWEKHPQQYGAYPYSRFQGDWSPTSPDNEYGPIRSHRIAEAARYGTTGLLVAVFVNDRKSNALDLSYDSKSGQLSFAPPGVSLYLGP